MKLKLICRNCDHDKFEFAGEDESGVFYACKKCGTVNEVKDFSIIEMGE